MTNAELIRAIRNEIERLKTIQLKRIQEGDLVDAEPYDKIEAYNELLSFLDTLEKSERPEPYNPVYDEAYLNEKIKKATESWKGVDVDAMLAECRGYDEEKSEKPMNQEGLGEEIHKYNKERFDEYFPEQDGDFISEVDFMTCLDRVAHHFAQCGAERQKEQDRLEIANIKAKLWQDGFDDCRKQMLKDAVEYEVWDFSSSLEAYPHVNIPLDNKQYRNGDKVRVIVLPKED